MGIQVEFNPDLALRNIKEYKKGARKKEECIPEDLEAGQVYPFLKREQRNFYLLGEIPLIETKGNGVLSRPKASIILEEVTHFMKGGELFSRGAYRVVEVFRDDRIYFECTDRAGTRE